MYRLYLYAHESRRMPHAALATDEEFTRRAPASTPPDACRPSTTCQLPRESEPDKRDKLIDHLVDSDAFVDRWTYYFEDLFRAGGRMGAGLNLFHYWMREWFKLDRPYNEVVTDLLTGAGKTAVFPCLAGCTLPATS